MNMTSYAFSYRGYQGYKVSNKCKTDLARNVNSSLRVLYSQRFICKGQDTPTREELSMPQLNMIFHIFQVLSIVRNLAINGGRPFGKQAGLPHGHVLH